MNPTPEPQNTICQPTPEAPPAWRRFLCLVVPLTALALITTYLTWGVAAAPAANAASLDPLAVQQNCAVLGVYLNGTQHTTRCFHARQASALLGTGGNSQAAVRPAIYYDSCYSGEEMRIVADFYLFCFYGSGYLGFYLQNVYAVYNDTGGIQEWYRMYFASGLSAFCNIRAGTAQYNTGTVTQVDIGAYNGNVFCY